MPDAPDPCPLAGLAADLLSAPELFHLGLGIDPGLSGALALVAVPVAGGPVRAAVGDLPTYTRQVKAVKQSDKSKRTTLNRGEFDYVATASLLRALDLPDLLQRFRVAAVCEAPSAGGKGGASTNSATALRSGLSAGMWPVAFALLRVPFEFVYPVSWKTAFGLMKAEKDASLAKARALFPDAPLARVKDHNRAEALLLAAYAVGHGVRPSSKAQMTP